MSLSRKPTSPLWKSISAGGGIIKGKWKVSRKVGEGAFGEIYSAVNILTLQSVAIKFEMVDTKKQVLKIEVAVLRKLQGKNPCLPSSASAGTCRYKAEEPPPLPHSHAGWLLIESKMPYIAELITCGRFNNYNFMVMELLGPNLSDYRRQAPTVRSRCFLKPYPLTHIVRCRESSLW